jgi:hypothetical protein
MNTTYMLLGIYNKPRLTIDEVAGALGMAKRTAYNQRNCGKFPVPMQGIPLTADVRDVADHLDVLRATST